MSQVRESTYEGHKFRHYHSISPNLRRVVPDAVSFMKRNNFATAYVADIIREIGAHWAATKSGQHSMLQNAVGGGVQVGDVVLQIKSEERTSRYQKSKSLAMTRGTLESVVGEPAAPARVAPATPQRAAPDPTGAFELLREMRAGFARHEAGLNYFEQQCDALEARIAKLEGTEQ